MKTTHQLFQVCNLQMLSNTSQNQPCANNSSRFKQFLGTVVLTVLMGMVGIASIIAVAASTARASESESVRGHILVIPRAGLPERALANILEEYHGEPRKIGQSDLYVVELPEYTEEGVVASLAGHSHLKFAGLDHYAPPPAIRNDSHYSNNQQQFYASILEPLAGATVSGLVPIDIEVTNNVGAEYAELWANNTRVAVDTSPPFAFTWDSKGVENSTANLVVRAFDAAGNAAISDIVDVNVDNEVITMDLDLESPIVEIINPVEGNVSDDVTITVNASDNSGAAGITLAIYIDNKRTPIATGTGSTLGTRLNTRPKKVRAGTHTIRAIATDKTGNTASTSVRVNVNTSASVKTSTPPVADSTASLPLTPVAPVVNLAERPFSNDSPWNQLIPANATYRSAGDPRTVMMRNLGRIWVNTDKWTMWVWQAKSTDPLVSIHVSSRNLDANKNDPWPQEGTVQIRMPADAHPDPTTFTSFDAWGDTDHRDAHMTIIDPDGKHAHEFWQARKDNGTGAIKAVSYVRVPLEELGVNISGPITQELTGSYYNPAFLSYGWGATRAYGGSNLGGLIRKDEVTKGPIKHAIAIALPPSSLKRGSVWPATDDDQSSSYSGPIPMGTRFAIPRSVDLQSLGLSPAHLRLAQALQDYGAIVVDKANGFVMYSEGSQAQADGNALNANGKQMDLLQSLLTVVE